MSDLARTLTELLADRARLWILVGISAAIWLQLRRVAPRGWLHAASLFALAASVSFAFGPDLWLGVGLPGAEEPAAVSAGVAASRLVRAAPPSPGLRLGSERLAITREQLLALLDGAEEEAADAELAAWLRGEASAGVAPRTRADAARLLAERGAERYAEDIAQVALDLSAIGYDHRPTLLSALAALDPPRAAEVREQIAEEPGGSGVVRLGGTMSEGWLVSPGGTSRPLGIVPAGRYALVMVFPDNSQRVLSLTVTSGGDVDLTCSAAGCGEDSGLAGDPRIDGAGLL